MKNDKLAAAVLAGLCALASAPAVWSQEASWPDFAQAAQKTGGGERDAAVIVGAENYAFVEHVPGAKRNADDWQAYLTETRKVPADRVALLLDDDATNDSILQAAALKAQEVKPGGTLWFVFIGHGAPSKDGKDGLLVGADAQQKASSLYSRSVSRNELLATLAKGKQARTVVILDACFSGKTPSGRALVNGLQPLIAVGGLPPGVDSRTVLMTAAKSDQFAGPLPGGSRPAFSYLALGALRGWAADAKGKVTAAAVVDYARRALSLAQDRAQTPELSTPAAGEVVLGSGRETGPDLAKLQRSAAGSSGGGFQLTRLDAVPKAEAPEALTAAQAGTLDFRNVDVKSLDLYNEVFELDRSADAAPDQKAQAWRRLAQLEPKFAEMAGKRADQWETFLRDKKAAEEAQRKRVEARDGDWQKLGHLLTLAVVSPADKAAWSSQFANAYLKSPGLEPAMTQTLLNYLPPGPMRRELGGAGQDVPKAAAAGARSGKGLAGIEWVRVPGGTFEFRGGVGDPRRETVGAFELSKTLVTNRQYRTCVDFGVCTPNYVFTGWHHDFPFSGDDQPVVGVTWDQAVTFAKWVGGRLPTAIEWEFAARNGGTSAYPWGDDPPTCERAVVGGLEVTASAEDHCNVEKTAPVCSKPAGNTKLGLCDMFGEAREWMMDPAYNRAYRATRGGGWNGYAHYFKSYKGDDEWPTKQDANLGFRVARGGPAKPAEQAPKAGTAIEWIKIPGGPLDYTPFAGKRRRHVTVKAFEMSKTLVTGKQYKTCVDAHACTPNLTVSGEGDDAQPAVGVDWDQAVAFAKWAGGRLPSDREWEYAARSGGKDYQYPWGFDSPTCERGAWFVDPDGHLCRDVLASAPVCSKPAGNTEQGLCDMVGNVEQWTQDAAGNDDRVVRGGVWSGYYISVPDASESKPRRTRDKTVGFRVVR